MKYLLASILVIASLLMPATTFAASSCGSGDNSSKGQALQGLNATGNTDCTGGGVSTLVSKTVNLLSYIVGFVAVIMVLVSGFKYVSSGGDSNAINSAKRTLIYAIVGLAIVALTQFISHFVIHTTNKAINTPPATTTGSLSLNNPLNLWYTRSKQ